QRSHFFDVQRALLASRSVPRATPTCSLSELDGARAQRGDTIPPMRPARAPDASWKAWLKENIERGCSRPELVEILRTNGFSLSSIQQNMGDAFPVDTPPPNPLQAPRPRPTH